MPATERSTLWVEGTDDLHTIKHLLARHDIHCPFGSDKHNSDLTCGAPRIKMAGGKDNVLNSMETAIRASVGRSVGFVLDADEAPGNRWQAVCSKLQSIENLSPKLPDTIPADGFVADAEDLAAKVGVWLMPDNIRSGALEEFLQELVSSSDLLLPHAQEATNGAKEIDTRFPERSLRKAILHTWLAWQKTPGLPYGSAVRSRYFGHDSPAALAFVRWFRRVFKINDHKPSGASAA